MTASTTPPTAPIVPESSYRQKAADFVLWALAQLQLPFEAEGPLLRLPLAEADRAAFDEQTTLKVALQQTSAEPATESIAWDGRFAKWLLEKLHGKLGAMHTRPGAQPMSVNDITATLFSAYQVEGGSLHLAGCQLTDHPFLRLSFAADEGDDPSVRHVFVSPDGSSVAEELVRGLGLETLSPYGSAPPRIDDVALRSLVAAGRRIAVKQSTDRAPQATSVEPLAVAIAWVRQAEGNLQFEIGDSSTTLGFSSWAKLLTPKPFVASGSGASTFHLAATDDGRIDAYEEIAACQESGRRALRQDLLRCSVTGKQLLPEFVDNCPVSGQPAQLDQFVSCSQCRQQVSSIVVEDARCAACRRLAKIRKDDPRLVWILGEHAGLDRWNRWQLSETETVYIAQAAKLTKKLFLVVDKESLAVRRLAVSGTLSRVWTDVVAEQHAQWLG